MVAIARRGGFVVAGGEREDQEHRRRANPNRQRPRGRAAAAGSRYPRAVSLPPDFASECLYGPDHWFVHELVSLDAERVHARVDTTRLGPLVDAQVESPGHPRHVPGAVMVQITGTLGNLHAVYVLGLRMSEGWSGFGTHIRGAKFPSIGRIGPTMDVELRVKRHRRFRGRHFVDYAYHYTQDGRDVYLSEQSAIWFHGPIDLGESAAT